MSSVPINRTSFLVDGFNLYHSLVKAGNDLGGHSLKWLDLRALCASYLHIIGNNAQVSGIYYFSAPAKHLESVKPDVVARHNKLIECMKATGVTVELGRFKKKFVHCTNCNTTMTRHEEKETDVAIAVKLLELFMTNSCDTAVLLTGDTDIAPAVRTAQRLFSGKEVVFAFPYWRKNKELSKLTARSFDIAKEQYRNYQFPDPFILPNGRAVSKPASW